MSDTITRYVQWYKLAINNEVAQRYLDKLGINNQDAVVSQKCLPLHFLIKSLLLNRIQPSVMPKMPYYFARVVF